MKKSIFLRLKPLLFLVALNLISCSKDDQQEGIKDEAGVTVDVVRTKGLTEINALVMYEFRNNEYVKTKLYKVSDEQNGLQNDIVKQKKILDLVDKIIPQNYKSFINEIVLFDVEDLGGYVHPLKGDFSSLQLGLSLAALEDETIDIEEVIVHELGHVLTFNSTQFKEGLADCETFKVDIPGAELITEVGVKACANDASYVNDFEQKFWKVIRGELERLNELEENDDPSYFQEKFEFDERHRDRFVSDYAATSFIEDIAEVFNYFVRGDKPTTNSKIKDQKILYMYENDELNSVRDFIRSNITFNISARKVNKKKKQFKYCLGKH